MDKTLPSAESGHEAFIYEGWLNVWEVGKDAIKSQFSEGRSPLPVWEPHLCVLNQSSRKLSHFRTEKAAHDVRQNMAFKAEKIGRTKEDFDRCYGYRPVDKDALLLLSPLAGLEAAFELRSQTLDARHVASSNTMHSTYDKEPSPAFEVDQCGGSTTSLNSQEITKPTANQSKLANFFTRKSQQFKSNLKRTKSATKLDRKKINGDPEIDQRLPPAFTRSLSLGRLSRRWLARPSLGHKGSNQKIKDMISEKILSQKMGKSYSHESLLSSTSSLHCIDLSIDGVDVRPVHPSIMGTDNCFVVMSGGGGGGGGCKYYSCSTAEERSKWLYHLRHGVHPMLDLSYRRENSVSIFIAEAKNLPLKKRFYCEICLDKCIYARTSSKPMAEMLFWGEQFDFFNLPSVETVTINLYKENEKKKKKDRDSLFAYVNISVSEISNRQMHERWYPASSAVVGRYGKENRAECASIRINARYQSTSILPISQYQPLILYLVSDYRSVVDSLEPKISVKLKEEIAASLVTTSHCLNCVNSFLCDIVMTEVNRLDNQTLALRGNSIATKAVESYMKLIGQKYLVNTLGDVVRMLLDPNLDCEVDSSRISSSLTLKTNQESLIAHCEMFWYKILNSHASFPKELKEVFSAIRDRCAEKEKSEICDQLISSCVFLRFFCPAILNPSLFNITQEYPNERGVRNLTLVAKTIQGLANFTRFGGKEEFMTFMNDFVAREFSSMHNFLNDISVDVSDDDVQKSNVNDNSSQHILDVDFYSNILMQFDGKVDLGKELAILHQLLAESLKDLAEDVKENLDSLVVILRDLTNAQCHPQTRPSTKRSQMFMHLGGETSTPSAAERIATLLTPMSMRYTFMPPPPTPTMVVSPLTPETISPESHFTVSEIKSPVELSFISATSLALFGSPSGYSKTTTPQFNVSTLPCSPSARRNSAKSGPQYQSTDNLVKITQPDFSSPVVVDENLALSVLSLSSRRPDEKQVNKDWDKLLAAADGDGTRGLKLIAFNERCTELNMKSLDRRNYDCETTIHVRPVFSTEPRKSGGGRRQQPLAFANPVYRTIDLNACRTGSGPLLSASVVSPSTGSQDSIDVGGGNRRRRSPSRFTDGTTITLKPTIDVRRLNQCFKSGSIDSLSHNERRTWREDDGNGRCLQFTIPFVSSSGSRRVDKQNNFSTTINIPLSKSVDFATPYAGSQTSLTVRRVATESELDDRTDERYSERTARFDISDDVTKRPDDAGSLYHETLTVYSSTAPLPIFKPRSMPKKRESYNNSEFVHQLDLLSQELAQTRAMVDDAELALLGTKHEVTSGGAEMLIDNGRLPAPSAVASDRKAGRPPVPPPPRTDIIVNCCDGSPSDERPRKKRGLRQKQSTKQMSLVDSELTSSASAASVASAAAAAAAATATASQQDDYSGVLTERVFTIQMTDQNNTPPFKSTYC